MASDPIDKVFDTCFRWYSKAQRAIDGTGKSIAEKFGSTKESVAGYYSSDNHSQTADSTGVTIFNNLNALKTPLTAFLGISAASILLWKLSSYAIPTLPKHLPNDDQVVLLLGDMRDPITRQEVLDLYRRNFVVFVCSLKEHSDIEDNDDDGLFHITPSPKDLSLFIKFLQDENKQLASILVMPNSSYYPSGSFANLSASQLEQEIKENFLSYWKVLCKVLPHFAYKVQVILFNPSLSKHFFIPHHSVEILISHLISGLDEILRAEYSRNVDLYTVHMGIVNIAGNPSNYKYLSCPGSKINTALLTPIFKLIMTPKYTRLRLLRFFSGNILFCGKGSRLGYYFGRLLPQWVLKWF